MQRDSNPANMLLAVGCVTVALFAVSLALIGAGAWFFLGTRMAYQRELLEQEVARAQDEAARAEAIAAAVPRSGDSLALTLDAAGTIELDGMTLSLAELRVELASRAAESRYDLTIHAAPDCEYRDVAAVLDLCRELELGEPRLETAR